MEPDISLSHSKEPVTCPYPVPDQSSPCPISLPVLEHLFYIIFLSMSGSSKRSLHQILYSPILCPIFYTNYRFSPCIFKVNHFYWPINALNCI